MQSSAPCISFVVWRVILNQIYHRNHASGMRGSFIGCESQQGETRRKEKPQELAAKKIQTVTEEMRELELGTAEDDFRPTKAAATDALNRVQEELVTKEIEQKVKLELENQKTQEKLNAFEASGVEETKAPSSLSKKLNVISGQTFGMLPQGSKRQSKNLSGGTSCYQEPKLTFRIQFHAFQNSISDRLRQQRQMP